MENLYYDYVIIGGGAAGLASGQYAARSGLKTVIIESTADGGQLMQITELENYPGVFPQVSGADLIETLHKQAESFGVSFESAAVTSIDKQNDHFVTQTKNKTFTSKALLIATGAVHRNLNVPGEKELAGCGVSYCAVCDGPFFRNKKIVVVGGGDSACSEAIYLSGLSKDVKIIHRRDTFRAQQAIVDKMISAGIEPVYNSVVKSINGNQKVESITLENIQSNETQQIECDAVFIFAGILPQTALVEMLPKDEAGYIKTDENMQTVVPGLFAAGDVRSKPFRQVVTAVSDGAVAAHSAAEFIRNSK